MIHLNSFNETKLDMVSNNGHKTLIQLKTERRNHIKNSLYKSIITPSLKSGKNSISQIAMIIDKKVINGIEAKSDIHNDINCLNCVKTTDDIKQHPIDMKINNKLCADCELTYEENIRHRNGFSEHISSSASLDSDISHQSMVSLVKKSDYDESIANPVMNNEIQCSNSKDCEQTDMVSVKVDENKSNEVKSSESIKKRRYKTLNGLLLTFISALFFSITTVIVKYVKDVHPGEMAVFRFTGILLFILPLLAESGQNPFGPSNVRHWLIIRGLAGATSLFFRYSALHYMSMADATIIVLSMPVFVCIFARIFLKESFGVFHVFTLIITFIGIGLTSKLAIIFGSHENSSNSQFDSNKQMIGLLFSLGATIVGASAYVVVRKLKEIHHSVILFNFAWVAISEMSIITYALDGFKLPDCGIAPWMLCLLSVFSFYGQLLLTKALQAEEAGLVSVTRASSEVIFAFIFQITIFREIPDIWSILGAVLVTSSVLLTSSRKYILTLPEESKTRRKLNFITK